MCLFISVVILLFGALCSKTPPKIEFDTIKKWFCTSGLLISYHMKLLANVKIGMYAHEVTRLFLAFPSSFSFFKPKKKRITAKPCVAKVTILLWL
ncbi:hypothetical protein HanRHA438_Chr14g0662911 [Helianthus annuus]|nr:hypothetical protein HanRHA438_Chr14g0662911 [Helianthus annuus]